MVMKRIAVGLFLCTAALSGQEAGSSSDAFYSAIRDNDLARLQAMLKGGANPNASDPRGGGTPLMHTAAVGSVEAMTVLLDRGADMNAANSVGATALMWAVTDIDKVRLLLARGADARVVSQRGRTALFLAARSDRSAEIVKLLIAAGADVRAIDAAKMTVLHSAAAGNDTETIRQVVNAGADVNAADFAGFTALIHAASNRNLDAVRLLLAKGADVNARSGDGSFQKVKAGSIALGYFTPLIGAAPLGSHELIATLLDAGAKINVADLRGMTPLMLAVANDRQNLDVIRLLVARGAEVNAKSVAGETALDWAVKIGAKPAIEALRRAGGVETAHQPLQIAAAVRADVRTAVERGRTLLAKASVVAAANGGCASCHSHNIVDTVERVALAKGMRGDEKLMEQRRTLTKAPYFSPANMFERLDPAGSPITTVFALTALANSGYQPDRTTDMVAAHLASQQSRDGRWFMTAIARPPVGEGPIAVTAYAIRALKAYAPPARSRDMTERIARATAWLAAEKAITTEDRNMQLLGLFWAGRGAAERERLAKVILAKQRGDGGWAQSDDLQTDAYATGSSLFALAEAGGITPDHAAYKKGVAYLLSSQHSDGSWYVKSRAVKFQPYLDGGFPYEHDQWISSMATGWATAALALALP
jgi:ankyrin repeat protein